MIGKKIKNPNPKSSKSERITRLTDYIREPEKTNGDEKCIYSGSRGFVCDDPKLQQTEMISLAMAATRSADPISHFVLSWKEGEYPTNEQIEEAVTIFMKECGVENHMAVYGLHLDTNNLHLHLAINRVNPATEKVARINGGFDEEAAHKAVARIVEAHGWEPEENALFFVDDNDKLVDTRIRDRNNRERKPSSRAQDYEQRTGEKSAERIGIETLPSILKFASNWDEFHTKMFEHGMKYERKGSGAIIWVGEQAIKASAADRNASLSKLEKRFGEYIAADAIPEKLSGKKISEITPQPLKEEFVSLGWRAYTEERQKYFSSKKSARLELNKHIDAEYKAMSERQREEREDIYGRNDWVGQGVLLSAMRSVVAAQHAQEKAELKERHAKLRKAFSRQFPPFSDFEQWLKENGQERSSVLWRYRHDENPSIFCVSLEPLRVYHGDIRDCRYTVNERGTVDYFRGNTEKPSFTDFGKRIEVADWRDENVTLAALQLSAQKWPKGFYLRGNEEYKQMCVKLAVEHGLKILNPELQSSIAEERERRNTERTSVGNTLEFTESTIQKAQNIYDAHKADLSLSLKSKIDESRIDVMIALRLRATGHSRDEIEKIISSHSPKVRSRGDYAKRITDGAFTPRADGQLESYSKHVERWKRLEDVTLNPQPEKNLHESLSKERINPRSVEKKRRSRDDYDLGR